MTRCPSCEYPLPEDRQRLGARCPGCHDPLYEPRGTPRAVRAGEAACLIHPTTETSGPCQRCGSFLCEVCRCRWRSQILCTTCVDRAMESREASPGEDRAHFRQALFGLLLGIGSWILAIVGYTLAVLVQVASGGADLIVGLLLLMVFASATVTALFGIGLSSAALLARGRHMILATFGLLLSGLLIGLVVGLLSLSIWLT